MTTEKTIIQLKSEAEILSMCLDALPFTKIDQKQQVQQLIETTLAKISQELNILKKERDRDKLELCRLRINRILLQNEKIFTSCQEFKQIVRSVPRIQQQDDQQQQLPYREMPKGKQQIQEPERILEISDYRALQSSINQLKFEFDSLARHVQTHDHEDYLQNIHQIQEENSRILTDYHLLKNDNTELLHTCNQLHRQIQIMASQNEDMFREIEMIKASKQPQQQFSSNPRYLIPTTKGNFDY